MATIPTLEGIESQMVDTGRIRMHVLSAGQEGDVPVLFVHGNVCSGTCWEEVMLELPDGFRGIAVDLRGYGDTEALPIDATKGLGDMVEDVHALVETLGLEQFHMVGHSMGGGVTMKYAIAHPERLLSIILLDTVSPYGYGGSKGADGEMTTDDGSPAGINPDFVRLLQEQDRGTDNPVSPRNVMLNFYFKPGFKPKREEELLSAMLATRIGDDFYPGEMVASEHWPGAAPGNRGVIPAFNRKHFDASAIVHIEPKPPILWVRGAEDQIVGDMAAFDLAALGALGAIPGYPGEEVMPPQPMIQQTKAVLEQYQTNGGKYREVVFEDAGHFAYMEKPERFREVFHAFLRGGD